MIYLGNASKNNITINRFSDTEDKEMIDCTQNFALWIYFIMQYNKKQRCMLSDLATSKMQKKNGFFFCILSDFEGQEGVQIGSKYLEDRERCKLLFTFFLSQS